MLNRDSQEFVRTRFQPVPIASNWFQPVPRCPKMSQVERQNGPWPRVRLRPQASSASASSASLGPEGPDLPGAAEASEGRHGVLEADGKIM